MYDLRRLKAESHIEEVAADLGLQPRKQGRYWLALCPAHDDQPGPGHRPNLSLDQAKGAKCFRCGFQADVIGLVMKAKGWEKGEAIRWLADRLGLRPEGQPGQATKKGQGLGYGRKARARASYPKGAPLPDSPAPATPGGDQKSLEVQGLDRAASAAHVNTAKIEFLHSGGGPEKSTSPEARPSGPSQASGREIPQGGASPAGRSRAIRLVFPAGAHVAVVGDHWHRREDGSIEADYPDREALELAMAAVGYPGRAGDDQADDQAAGETAPATIAPRAPAKSLTLRVKVFEALLGYATLVTGETPTKGGQWLRDQKGLTFETLTAAGIRWLDPASWAKADRELKTVFGVDALAGLGLLTERGQLRFRYHCLIFPFWLQVDGVDRPVYLQARNIWAQDKRKRFLRPSGSTPCPYNFNAVMVARSTGQRIFIAEGETDTLTLKQSGRLACGIVGTQGFKPEWVKYFAGLPVFLAFDPDRAGQESAMKVAGVFVSEGLPPPRLVRLPDGQDVNDFFTGRSTKPTAQTDTKGSEA